MPFMQGPCLEFVGMYPAKLKPLGFTSSGQSKAPEHWALIGDVVSGKEKMFCFQNYCRRDSQFVGFLLPLPSAAFT